MHDLSESAPVNSGIIFFRISLNQFPHLFLKLTECSKKLMSGSKKRRSQIRHNIAQAKRFSVLLEAIHLGHLVCQVSA